MTECSQTSPKTNTYMEDYRGRFAPSPTGLLHMGSLFAAVASWLHAKQQGGTWLVRMEDLDPPREQAGTADNIIQTLSAYGLDSDEAVLLQSQRLEHYQTKLEQLLDSGDAYRCYCSRKQVAAAGLAGAEGWRYNGHCRDEHKVEQAKQHCIRLDSRGEPISFHDELQGRVTEEPEALYGDFPLKRADGYFAYQLAVVLDDAEQGISHIVRGIDLMSSTTRQIRLQQTLGLTTPKYCHLPVLVADNGQKLSKQNLAQPIPSVYDPATLERTLRFLGLNPPNELKLEKPQTLLNWALVHWQADMLQGQQHLSCTPTG